MIVGEDNLTEKTSNFNFDVYDWVIFVLGCSLVVPLVLFSIYQFNKSNYDLSQSKEQECVTFYKENGYVLETCDEYKDKLLKLELKDVDVEE